MYGPASVSDGFVSSGASLDVRTHFSLSTRWFMCPSALLQSISNVKKKEEAENGNGNKSERQTAQLKKSARTGFRRQPREYVLQIIRTLEKKKKKKKKKWGGKADGLSKF